MKSLIREQLFAIKKRPGMFLAKVDLDNLQSYLIGYFHSSKDKCTKLDSSFIYSFHVWIEESEFYECNLVPQSIRWSDYILHNSDEEALEKFFELSDIFFEQECKNVGE